MVEFIKMGMDKEYWLDAIGFEGYYEVSSHGNVRRFGKEVNRKLNVNSGGYHVLSLSKEGNISSHSVHTMVAEAFKGHIPDGTQKLVIDHIDGDKTNNHVDNLQPCTNRANVSKGRPTTGTGARTSEYVGVSMHKSGFWIAHIGIKPHRSLHLGTFVEEVDAAQAYQTALAKFLSDEDHYRDEVALLSHKERREYLLGKSIN